MIAKFISSLILITGLSSALSQSISTKDFHYYVQVAHDFDIHPPELTCGYPWWYDADTLPVTGIIFLKENLDNPIEKLNDTAWVVEPSKFNARLISDGLKSGKKSIQKITIVPDSSLNQKSLHTFILNLNDFITVLKLRLVDENGSYIVQNFINYSNEGVIFCPRYRDVLDIKFDKDKVLIKGEIIGLDELALKVNYAYTINWSGEMDHDFWSTEQISREKILRSLEKYREILPTSENSFFIKWSTSKYLRLKIWNNKYFTFQTLDKSSWIHVEFVSDKCKLNHSYHCMDLINKGLLNARNDLSHEYFGVNYIDLICNRQFDKAQFINFQMPDMIFYF